VLEVWNSVLPFKKLHSVFIENESWLGWLELHVDGSMVLSNQSAWKREWRMKEQTPPDCTSCNGTGRVWYRGCDDSDSPCHDCNGEGFIIKPE
tara:strand:+ start:5470 stop:5748 length:279 start_codon:yes stop_codon:yes gene_type:complete